MEARAVGWGDRLGYKAHGTLMRGGAAGDVWCPGRSEVHSQQLELV